MHVIANNHPFLRFSKGETLKTVRSVLRGEKLSKTALSVVFTHHHYIRKLNRQFLDHDFSTDVIAFPLDPEGGVAGEIYINLDKVRKQAREYDVTYRNETKRLLIHGILHLLGYKDSTAAERVAMKRKEDYYLYNLGEEI